MAAKKETITIKKTVAKKVSPKKTKKITVNKKVRKPKSTGLTIDIFNTQGKVAETLSLKEEIFGAKINPILMAQAVRVYLANQRQGNASTKTRSEVTGSTRKIYRQKGTGRARHGDIKAPIFVGGGVAHGPHPKDFSQDMSKVMKRKALFSALTTKLKSGNIAGVNGVDDMGKKTKEMINILKNLNMVNDKNQKINKVLMVLPKKLANVILAGRNVEGLDLTMANLLNAYEVLNHNKILFLKNSLDVLEKTFLKEKSPKYG